MNTWMSKLKRQYHLHLLKKKNEIPEYESNKMCLGLAC